MTADPQTLATLAAWTATAAGLGLWLYGWFGPGDALRKQRLSDCGMVLVFAAALTRVVIKTQPLNAWDWFLAVLSPVFIGLALWRLDRSARQAGGR